VKLPKGIERTPFGFRVWQWVNGRNRSKRFKRDATIKKMQDWQEDVRVAARTKTTIDESRELSGFAADVVTYLEAVKPITSYRDRVRDMAAWLERIGDEPSANITALEIRLARDAWRTKGPKRVQRRNADTGKREWVFVNAPLSASAVNHRLRALENFFTVMYPKADNPVRDVDECDEPPLQPKGQTFALGYEVLSFMPDRTAPKKGGTHEPGSLSRIRFETMLVTGLTPKQLSLLEEQHVDWTVPSFIPPKRSKGRRSRRARARQQPRARSLMPAALPVLKQFFTLGANKKFSQTSLGRSVKRAIRAANVARAKKNLPEIPETLTPYELTRHTFGTEIYRQTKNLKVVQELLGHADIRQSERYALAAVQEHQVAAVGQLSKVARRASRSARKGETSPRTSPRRGKSKQSRRTSQPPEP
jgi:integrase